MRRPYVGRIPQCLKCEPRIIQPGEVKVRLLYGGQTKIVHRALTSSIRCKGEVYRVKALRERFGTIVLLVDESAWVLGRGRTRAIKGLPVAWPDTLSFEADVFVNLLEDLCHYLRLGECCPVTIQWWVSKFRPRSKKDTGLRAWERFKKRLRDVGAPAENETVWKSRQESPEIALRIARKEFVRDVEREARRRRRAKGVEASSDEIQGLG